MPGIPPSFSSGRRNGCLGSVLFVLWLAVVVSLVLRSCDSPYGTAKRMMKADPYRAAQLLATEVRADYRESRRSLLLLLEIQDPSVLPVLVNMMDLPDGEWITKEDRALIFDNVKARVTQMPAGASAPDYDPAAPLSVRAGQREAWIRWIADRANDVEME